jgi:hypothetical protein
MRLWWRDVDEREVWLDKLLGFLNGGELSEPKAPGCALREEDVNEEALANVEYGNACCSVADDGDILYYEIVRPQKL